MAKKLFTLIIATLTISYSCPAYPDDAIRLDKLKIK